MTNKTHSSISIFCFAFILLCHTNVFAQPVMAPFQPDNNMIYYCGEGFGTAMINYSTIAPIPANTVIFGAAWESACSEITVTDVGTGTVATCMPSGLPPSGLWSYSCIPDVVIGNTATPGTFVMAVAYSQTSSFGTDIIVDFYDITRLPLTVSFHSSVTVATLLASSNGEDVHIDIIAEHPTSGVLANCQKFGLAFEDQAGTGDVFVALGNVSTYTVGPPVPVASGTQMDIAAIQRNVAPSGPPVVHDYGLLTWIMGTNVMYGEYDFTTMTLTAVASKESSGTFSSPRIDGDDDYTTNSPTGTTVVYEAAYQVNYSICSAAQPYYNSATIHTFNNLVSAYDPTTGLPGSFPVGVGSFNPVTVQTGGGKNKMGGIGFDVFHWAGSSFTMGCPARQEGAMMMEPININTGTMSPNPYYEVSTGGSPSLVGPNIYNNFIYVWHGGEWSISASNTCNTAHLVTSLNLYAWVQLGIVAGSAPQGAMYKLSSASPYSFREANPITGTIGVSQKMSLLPNPNNGTFSINGSVPTDKANDEATIEITDLLGNTVFTTKAPVTNGAINTQVNLGGNLASGMYMARFRCASFNQVTKFTLHK